MLRPRGGTEKSVKQGDIAAEDRAWPPGRLQYPAVFKDAFYFILVSHPPGGPGEGPDCHLLEGIEGFGPIPARIRWVMYFSFLFWP